MRLLEVLRRGAQGVDNYRCSRLHSLPHRVPRKLLCDMCCRLKPVTVCHNV